MSANPRRKAVIIVASALALGGFFVRSKSGQILIGSAMMWQYNRRGQRWAA